MRLITFSTVLILISCKGASKTDSILENRPLYFADNRNADSLFQILKNADSYQQTEIFFLLAQIQDTTLVDSLMKFANDRGIYTDNLFYALGQTGDGTNSISVKEKIERFISERPKPLTKQQIIALGKTASQRSIPLVISELARATRSSEIKELCLASARMAIREIKSDSLDNKISQFLKHPDNGVRFASVYAIMRSKNKKIAGPIISLLRDADDQVKMTAARGLENMRLSSEDSVYKSAVNELVTSAQQDADWRVRVSSVNALGSCKFKEEELKKIYFLIALEASRDKNLHVRLAAIRSIAKSYSQDIKDPTPLLTQVVEKYVPASDWHEKTELASSMILMFKEKTLDHPGFRRLLKELQKDPDAYVRAKLVEALGETKSEKVVPDLEATLRDTFSLVRLNSIEALSKINTNRSKELILKTLDSKDALLLSVSAGVLSADEQIIKDQKKCDAISEKVIAAYQKFQSPVETDALIGILNALGDLKSKKSENFMKPFLWDSNATIAHHAAAGLEKISGERVATVVKPKVHSIDLTALAKIQNHKPRASIQTNKGVIEIEFYSEESPLTVVNFVRLSEQNFFDGKLFHRVVPNFVIQGGDPLGTGWGGPGYSIRSEFSPIPYVRGTVGMASSGKDTEGSQWFITQSAQPHLDGHYTVFAKVRSGMDVVDNIQVGDSVRTIRIIWN